MGRCPETRSTSSATLGRSLQAGTSVKPESQSGIVNVFALNVMASAAAGVVAIGGTLADVIAGAAPGVPPRGMVRTTWLGGNAVPFLRFAYMRSNDWIR